MAGRCGFCVCGRLQDSCDDDQRMAKRRIWRALPWLDTHGVPTSSTATMSPSNTVRAPTFRENRSSVWTWSEEGQPRGLDGLGGDGGSGPGLR